MENTTVINKALCLKKLKSLGLSEIRHEENNISSKGTLKQKMVPKRKCTNTLTKQRKSSHTIKNKSRNNIKNNRNGKKVIVNIYGDFYNTKINDASDFSFDKITNSPENKTKCNLSSIFKTILNTAVKELIKKIIKYILLLIIFYCLNYLYSSTPPHCYSLPLLP